MPTTDRDNLLSLIRTRQPCVLLQTFEEDHALLVAREAAVQLGQELLVWTCTLGLHDGLIEKTSGHANTEHPAGALEYLARRADLRGPVVMCDLLTHVSKDEKILRLLRDAISRFARERRCLILIDHCDTPPPAIAAIAARLQITYPGPVELEQIVIRTLRELRDADRVSIDFSKSQMRTLLKHLSGLTRRQARQAILEAGLNDNRFDESDLPGILKHKRRMLAGSGLLEFVESPASMDEIGGLARMKQWLDRRRRALDDEAEQFGIDPPRGVLMLGVQGAGKSLAAKSVATAWERPLLKMDVGALYDRYVGESERRLRDALSQAEAMSPVILWIDEIEKAFASAASHSTDGGLSKRMFGCLLTWMQEHKKPVFTIATANDIEALPPELLRKGRFDEVFFVDLPVEAARQQILSVHLLKRGRQPASFDLARLARLCEGFSGAEIEQAIIAGLHDAFANNRELTTDDIAKAIEQSPPLSVTMAEKVNALRRWAKDRCVPAD